MHGEGSKGQPRWSKYLVTLSIYRILCPTFLRNVSKFVNKLGLYCIDFGPLGTAVCMAMANLGQAIKGNNLLLELAEGYQNS